MRVECPACGSDHHQKEINQFKSAVRIECGVCGATYGVKRPTAALQDVIQKVVNLSKKSEAQLFKLIGEAGTKE